MNKSQSQAFLRRSRSSMARLTDVDEDKDSCPPAAALRAPSKPSSSNSAAGTASTLWSLLGFVLVGWFLCFGYVSSNESVVRTSNWNSNASTNSNPNVKSSLSSATTKTRVTKTTSATKTATLPSATPTKPSAHKKTIAYAVSLIKCGDGKQNAAHGLTEAALVLRHSIHHISSRNAQSGSSYDYKLYALVHRQAASCAQPLADAGYELRMVDPPVTQSEIQGDFLRNTIHKEVCCGADEFVKLHSYSLPEDISVHVDMDFLFLQPMDHLFDAILYGPDTPQGQLARTQLVEQGLVETFHHHGGIPEGRPIDAFFVRDWFSTFPGRKSPYQAGFMVARRDPTIVQEAADIVRVGNYTEGFSPQNGWGGMGYGGFVGARAMQGLMAYYYDVVRPHTHVELDSCRYNHIGAQLMTANKGCKTGTQPCPDCRRTPLDQIYSIHYTVCRKPWNCVAEAVPGGRTPGASYGDALDPTVVDVKHCWQATEIWHRHRADLERRLFQHFQTTTTAHQRSLQPMLSESGNYRKEHFLGHCVDEKKYLQMQMLELLANSTAVEEVYQSPYSEAPLAYMPV